MHMPIKINIIWSLMMLLLLISCDKDIDEPTNNNDIIIEEPNRDWRYEDFENGIVIREYIGNPSVQIIIIPEKINGKNVLLIEHEEKKGVFNQNFEYPNLTIRGVDFSNAIFLKKNRRWGFSGLQKP